VVDFGGRVVEFCFVGGILVVFNTITSAFVEFVG
jgi:hypothetical protein